MELPYKIRINNSLSVKIGYFLSMSILLIGSVFILYRDIYSSDPLRMISSIFILGTLLYLLLGIIYRLFTEIIISDDIIEIKNICCYHKINKVDIIGYQGGLNSYVDPKFKFKNFSYFKYIYTSDMRLFFFIEDNKSAFYFNNYDEKKPVEVNRNVDKKMITGLSIKPLLQKGSLALVFLSISFISGWYLSLSKINKSDSYIILGAGIILLGYSLLRLSLYFYYFLIKGIRFTLYQDSILLSDRRKKSIYSLKEINENNQEILFVRYNKLLNVWIGKYLFNGNEYLLNRVFY